MPKPYKSKPPLKVAESSEGRAYIAFEEYVDIPGLESADIRIEFENIGTYDEVAELAKRLKAAGFVFVVQK